MVGPLSYKGKLDKKGFLRNDDKYGLDIPVNHLEIEKIGLYKIKPLYEELHRILEDEWSDPRGGTNFEDLYWERYSATGLKDLHIWWRLVRTPDWGSDLFRYALKIDFQGLAISKGEVAYKGKKKKVEQADFIIRIWLWVQFDWQNKIKNSFLAKIFGEKTAYDWFMKHWLKKEIQFHKDYLYDFGEKLKGFIKDYLEMEEAGERKRLFHPEMGYKDQF